MAGQMLKRIAAEKAASSWNLSHTLRVSITFGGNIGPSATSLSNRDGDTPT
jgi:hypothetical protein